MKRREAQPQSLSLSPSQSQSFCIFCQPLEREGAVTRHTHSHIRTHKHVRASHIHIQQHNSSLFVFAAVLSPPLLLLPLALLLSVRYNFSRCRVSDAACCRRVFADLKKKKSNQTKLKYIQNIQANTHSHIQTVLCVV